MAIKISKMGTNKAMAGGIKDKKTERSVLAKELKDIIAMV